MNTRPVSLLLSALFGSTALISAAVAQAPAGQVPPGQECQSLQQMISANPDRLPPEWVQQANGAVLAGDTASCTTLMAQANTTMQDTAPAAGATPAVGVAQPAAAESARIVVTQPEPQVTVEQTPPQISVTQPQSQVNVDQGQPEILVRQAAPTVRVQVPQPVITIDMPQPEIIVRMPDPTIAVTTPEPQIEVRQAQPTVSVTQAEPQVQVQAAPVAPAEPQIQVEQGQAQVTQVPTEGEAQVNVQRQEPVVRYEAAQPNIQVEQGGEPQVQFNQTGEPNIRIEQGPAEAGQPNAEPAPAVGQPAPVAQPTAVDNPPQGASGNDADVLALIRVIEPVEAGQPTPMPASALIGQPLVNARGAALGNVESIVRVGDAPYVVLASDSPLARDNRGVVLPLNNISLISNQMTLRGLTDEELAQLQGYDGTQAQAVGNDEQVQVGQR